ncbi:MAG: chemotaxis response regulator protein-glutamate methylesterase [Clostridium sp.]|nr:chemotaxis response regulator protein-glutamate methylesterase [Clostridium sp.]MCM1547129.1 chemotaxis response regulator protein-glutamate methylesterase [Ruminococcus sp.]
MLEKKIKLLIVDDSVFFRETLAKFFANDKIIDVVGRAGDPYEARDKIIQLRPDVMTLDVEMPKMSGIQFLKKVIPQYPIPTVIVSSAPIKAFDALDAGAVDYVKKALIKNPQDMQSFAVDLRNKVITASQAKVIQKRPGAMPPGGVVTPHISGTATNMVIAMGASTGGTDALQTVLTTMPANSPPIVIVQHMPPVFTKMFADRLNKLCKIEIKEAENGDRLRQGLALLAPGDFQMSLQKDVRGYYVKVAPGEKVSGHRPSVDHLFHSVAKVAGKNVIGVIMTGMGSDGANGMVAMKNAGAYTIGQDKDSCVVYGMPMCAYNQGGCCIQVPLDKISATICKQL